MRPEDALKKARSVTGKKQHALAAAIGLTTRAWRMWETGETPLNMERMKEAARAHGFVSWEELLAAVGELTFSQQIPPGAAIAVFEEVPAGNGDFDPTLLGEDNGFSSEMFPLSRIPPKARRYKRLFAVVVKGDSMAPDYAEGDTVFCADDAEHVQGMVAVYRLDDGDCGIKMLESHGPDAILIPRNPKHITRRVRQEQIVRIARVVAHLKATI